MRELLKKMGLTPEQIDEVMTEHGKTVNGLNDELKDKDREINTLQTDTKAKDNQISQYEKEIEKLKDSDNPEEYKEQIENLKKEAKRIEKEKDKELEEAKKKHLADLEVLKHNPYDPEDVIAFVDMESVTLSEDGKSLVGFSDQVEALKERKKHWFPSDEGDDDKGDVKPPYSGGNPQSGNSDVGGGEPLSDYEKGQMLAKQRHEAQNK